MRHYFKKIKKGFTLIETLVAISIISIALVPPMLIAHQGVSSTNFAKDQMVAQYLAQDAMDFIIAKKNTNIIHCGVDATDGDGADAECDNNTNNGTDGMLGEYWLAGMASCFDNNSCKVDTGTGTITSCPGTCPIAYDEATKRYGDNGTATKFQRKVNIKTALTGTHTGNVSNEAAIYVTVSWRSTLKQGTASITVRANIFNVKP